jgi:Cd2+/Zn2+-exporting ATPase/Cu+-exporting ATPase
LAIGEFFTALVITGFVLAAEVLEGLTVGRGRRAIQSLLDFLPRTVTVRRRDQVVELASEQVQIGDTVIVKPGGRIPVDGVVLSGSSFVEQAAITGEAMPVEKAKGDAVVTLRSAKSSKRSSMLKSPALRFKRPQIGWQATSCSSRLEQRF